jgi:hypothetical protein
MKISKERDGPTGDFNIHMAAVVDKDIVNKREAIQAALVNQKAFQSSQP